MKLTDKTKLYIREAMKIADYSSEEEFLEDAALLMYAETLRSKDTLSNLWHSVKMADDIEYRQEQEEVTKLLMAYDCGYEEDSDDKENTSFEVEFDFDDSDDEDS